MKKIFLITAGTVLGCAMLSCNKQNDASPSPAHGGSTAKTGLYDYAAKTTEEVIADARERAGKTGPKTSAVTVKVNTGTFDDKNSTDSKIACTKDGPLCSITITKNTAYPTTKGQVAGGYSINGSASEPIELIIAKPAYPELKLATKINVSEQNGVTIINADYVD